MLSASGSRLAASASARSSGSCRFGLVIAQFRPMGMSPVRRAFVILAVAAVVVAIFLLLAQDNFTLKIPERRRGPGSRARRPTSRRSSAPTPTRGNDYDVLTNGDQVFPAMLEAIRGAKRRISFESYIYDTGEIANQFTAALEEAARRGVRVSIVVDAVGSSTMDDAHVERLKSAGCRIASFSPHPLVFPRGSELPQPPQDPGRRRRDRVYRRRRDRRPLAGQRAGAGALARHARPDPRPDRAPAGSGLLRELQRGGRRSDAGARSPGADPARRRLVRRRPELAERRQQRPDAALPAVDCLGARDDRHHEPVLRHGRVDALGAEGGRRTRRQDPDPRRRGHHRRDAGEVRVARRSTSSCSTSASRYTSTSRR